MTASPSLGTVLSRNALNVVNMGTWLRCARTYSDVGAVHTTNDCLGKEDQSKYRCVNCRGAHRSWDRNCPVRVKRTTMAKQAYNDRPIRFAVPGPVPGPVPAPNPAPPSVPVPVPAPTLAS